jgi:hypothetical protein
MGEAITIETLKAQKLEYLMALVPTRLQMEFAYHCAKETVSNYDKVQLECLDVVKQWLDHDCWTTGDEPKELKNALKRAYNEIETSTASLMATSDVVHKAIQYSFMQDVRQSSDTKPIFVPTGGYFDTGFETAYWAAISSGDFNKTWKSQLNWLADQLKAKYPNDYKKILTYMSAVARRTKSKPLILSVRRMKYRSNKPMKDLK